MNDDTNRDRSRPWRQRAAILAATASIALLATACGSSSSTGDSGSPGGSSSTANPGSSATRQKTVTWPECMRSHGVDVPTSAPSPAPTGTGGAVKLGGPVVNPNSPRYHAALQACQALQPGGSRLGG